MFSHLDDKIAFIGFNNLPGWQGEGGSALRDLRSGMLNFQTDLLEQFPARSILVAFALFQPATRICPKDLPSQRTVSVFEPE